MKIFNIVGQALFAWEGLYSTTTVILFGGNGAPAPASPGAKKVSGYSRPARAEKPLTMSSCFPDEVSITIGTWHREGVWRKCRRSSKPSKSGDVDVQGDQRDGSRFGRGQGQRFLPFLGMDHFKAVAQ